MAIVVFQKFLKSHQGKNLMSSIGFSKMTLKQHKHIIRDIFDEFNLNTIDGPDLDHLITNKESLEKYRNDIYVFYEEKRKGYIKEKKFQNAK